MKHELDTNTNINVKIIERTESIENNNINKLQKPKKIIDMPGYKDYLTFIQQSNKNNYKVPELKEICKHYNLRCSGLKPEITDRIYRHLFNSNFGCIIQRYNRRYLIKKYNRLIGPAVIKRRLCMNCTDFFTLDNMDEIPYTQFFSYKGENDAVWGFDIISFYNLVIKTKTKTQTQIGNVEILNPYTREIIQPKYFDDINRIVKISKFLHIVVDTTLNDNIESMSIQKQIELRCLELFQYMDGLGNYTDIKWFLSLDRVLLLKFTNEIMDIWMYRAQLPDVTKRQICYPSGDPFRYINPNSLGHTNLNQLQKFVLTIIEQFIKTGVDREMQNLGASYILCGLTLVNSDAALALPWLFQSVS